jgi:regulatory protein
LISLEDKARRYAVRLLSYRGRSVRELEDRLKRKGFSDDVVASTVWHLQHAGLLDDVVLADALKREAITTKFMSQYGAKKFMLARGISREIVDSIFRDDETEDFKNAKRLADKKMRIIGILPAEKIKRRLSHLLLRKGYSFETIQSVLKQINVKEV